MLTTEHDLRANRQLDEAIMVRFEKNMTIAGLSPMEKVIARGIRKGQTPKELAYDIGLREQTVKNHITHINQKLGTHDRLQIVQRLQGVL